MPSRRVLLIERLNCLFLMNPTQLSHELRNGQSPDLTRRRWIIGLSLVTVVAGQIVTLYQTGIIKHLPDPPSTSSTPIK